MQLAMLVMLAPFMALGVFVVFKGLLTKFARRSR